MSEKIYNLGIIGYGGMAGNHKKQLDHKNVRVQLKGVYDIDPARMEWNGRGSKEPIESNKTEEGRAENRRVEFKILSE